MRQLHVVDARHGLLEGVRIAGAAAFVSESMDPDSTALIY